jgi:nitrate/nitrite transport system permease protein
MNTVVSGTAAHEIAVAPPSLAIRLRPLGKKLQAGLINLAPLAVMLVLIGCVWQLATSHAGSGLPSPAKIWTDSHELILHPFYDRGGLDKGLGLHLLASLQRVALGFALSASVGVALGMLVGTSAIATRGLAPIFQVLRTVPPLAWLPLSLAAFRVGPLRRNLHHCRRGAAGQRPRGFPGQVQRIVQRLPGAEQLYVPAAHSRRHN